MSWAEIKKAVNSDLGTPLDSLIKAENASRRRIFFYTGSAQNFTVPAGVIYITGCGGGGGSHTSAAGNGGNTIIGSLVTLVGGTAGTGSAPGAAGGPGGGAGGSTGALAGNGILGSGGNQNFSMSSGTLAIAGHGGGGSLGCGKAGQHASQARISVNVANEFGFHGGGGGSSTATTFGGGGADAIWHKEYSVTPGDNLNIDVGAPGPGTGNGAAGGAGLVIIEW